MTPGALLFLLVIWLACAFAGQAIGKPKGLAGAGFGLGLFLGVIGVIIIACMPKSREAEIEQAQRQYEIQAEAARRAGVPVPAPASAGTVGAVASGLAAAEPVNRGGITAMNRTRSLRGRESTGHLALGSGGGLS